MIGGVYSDCVSGINSAYRDCINALNDVERYVLAYDDGISVVNDLERYVAFRITLPTMKVLVWLMVLKGMFYSDLPYLR